MNPKFYTEDQWLLKLPVKDELISEFGSCMPVQFGEGTLYDSDGFRAKCKCGNEACASIIGKDSYMHLCSKCMYGEG